MHTLMYYDVLSFCRPRARSCTMSDYLYFPFQCCLLIPTCGMSVIRTCTLFSVLVLSIYDYIFILFSSLYIFIVSHVYDSVVTLFPLYILSLSFIMCLLDLSLAITVKRTYGQWMVYGEFNTLVFVFSPRLTYKF